MLYFNFIFRETARLLPCLYVKLTITLLRLELRRTCLVHFIYFELIWEIYILVSFQDSHAEVIGIIYNAGDDAIAGFTPPAALPHSVAFTAGNGHARLPGNFN